MKGGIQYFSLVILAIASCFGILFLLLFTQLLIFLISPSITGVVTGTMTYNLYEGPKTEDILLTYLDSTYKGKRMSDLLARAVYLDKNVFFVDGNEIDIVKASEEIMGGLERLMLFDPYKLSLKIGGQTTILLAGTDMEKATSAQALISAADKEGLIELQRG